VSASKSAPVRDDEVVHLDLPATSGRLRLVRLAVVGLATEYGADVDDLEDVRIATGEICTHLVNGANSGARLLVEIRVSPDSSEADLVIVGVRAEVEGLPDPGPLDELSDMVLATTASQHGVESDATASRTWFRRELRAVPDPVATDDGGPGRNG
jgi:serine/threonine-protein kinase RsbW